MLPATVWLRRVGATFAACTKVTNLRQSHKDSLNG